MTIIPSIKKIFIYHFVVNAFLFILFFTLLFFVFDTDVMGLGINLLFFFIFIDLIISIIRSVLFQPQIIIEDNRIFLKLRDSFIRDSFVFKGPYSTCEKVGIFLSLKGGCDSPARLNRFFYKSSISDLSS